MGNGADCCRDCDERCTFVCVRFQCLCIPIPGSYLSTRSCCGNTALAVGSDKWPGWSRRCCWAGEQSGLSIDGRDKSGLIVKENSTPVGQRPKAVLCFVYCDGVPSPCAFRFEVSIRLVDCKFRLCVRSRMGIVSRPCLDEETCLLCATPSSETNCSFSLRLF